MKRRRARNLLIICWCLVYDMGLLLYEVMSLVPPLSSPSPYQSTSPPMTRPSLTKEVGVRKLNAMLRVSISSSFFLILQQKAEDTTVRPSVSLQLPSQVKGTLSNFWCGTWGSQSEERYSSSLIRVFECCVDPNRASRPSYSPLRGMLRQLLQCNE